MNRNGELTDLRFDERSLCNCVPKSEKEIQDPQLTCKGSIRPLLQALILRIQQEPRYENPSCVIFCKIFRNKKKDNLLEAREGFRWLNPSACGLV